MSGSMIERVKAALIANLREQGYTTAIDADGFCLIDTTVDMNLFARAAIKSLREPTKEMVLAGDSTLEFVEYEMRAGRMLSLADTWSAMIGTALSEGGATENLK